MKKQTIFNIKGEKVGDISLSEEVFGIVPNDTTIYDAITLARNSMRQGTASVKNRGEVRGGGIKPWKQKGTGRARQGSIRAPQWVGGGVVFGPTPRSFDRKQNRKERRLALRSILSYKAMDDELIVIDNMNLESNKTKDFKIVLSNLKIDGRTVIVVDKLSEDMILASRNLSKVLLLESSEINVLDIANSKHMIITKEAVNKIEEVLK